VRAVKPKADNYSILGQAVTHTILETKNIHKNNIKMLMPSLEDSKTIPFKKKNHPKIL
jgi:hypothetical protein